MDITSTYPLDSYASGALRPTSSEPVEEKQAPKELTQEEKKEVQELKKRDQEVRAHEQAHAAQGGAYAGSPAFSYETGPDGVRYAVGGEVSIDTSPVPNDPEATVKKMQTVRRAALAPQQPSGQDHAVAAKASSQEQKARVEMEKASKAYEEVGASFSQQPLIIDLVA